jgi:hypothetical protein
MRLISLLLALVKKPQSHYLDREVELRSLIPTLVSVILATC